MRFGRLTVLCLVGAIVVLGACKSGGVKDDPILRLSAQEALDTGKDLLEQEKYSAARDHLTHAFEVEPNSASGREALLLVADSHFQQRGLDNFIKAEAKYRDFQNRFPTSDKAAYVQFQIANSLAERIRKPDRDLKSTETALEAYEELLRLYPTSMYSEPAREEIRSVRKNLAEHEFGVGRFYIRYRLPQASVDRFEGLLERFPEYEETDKVLFFLARAYQDLGKDEEAEETRERLRSEYPASTYVGKLN